MLGAMRCPIFVHPLTDAERQVVEAGLRSSDAFTLRRCQIVRASAQGDRVPAIARALGCNEQTVRNAVHAVNRDGLAALQEGVRDSVPAGPLAALCRTLDGTRRTVEVAEE